MSWLTRLFSRKVSSQSSGAADPDLPPVWAAELLDAVQKASRSQARAIARIEDLESKLEGGFADLRAAISVARPAPGTADPGRLEAVLDALDILDQARRTLSAAGHMQVEQGLAGVAERMDAFLAAEGLARRPAASEPLDGKLFRVVGTIERPDLPNGAPAQVVRAAVSMGERVIREGEVLVNRR